MFDNEYANRYVRLDKDMKSNMGNGFIGLEEELTKESKHTKSPFPTYNKIVGDEL